MILRPIFVVRQIDKSVERQIIAIPKGQFLKPENGAIKCMYIVISNGKKMIFDDYGSVQFFSWLKHGRNLKRRYVLFIGLYSF